MAITEADAIRLAKEECVRRGWAWIEPTGVYDIDSAFRVGTATDKLGGGACLLVVDKTTGKILSAQRYLR